MKCKLRTKAVDWYSSVHTDHKTLNNEAYNKDEYVTT